MRQASEKESAGFLQFFSVIFINLNHIGCLPSITRENTADSAFHVARVEDYGGNSSIATTNNSPARRIDDDFYILRKYDETTSDKIEMNVIRNSRVSTCKVL